MFFQNFLFAQQKGKSKLKKEFNFYHKLIQKLIKNIGRTNNLLIKGVITVLFPTLFFKTFYSCATPNKKISNTVTISFDCDQVADIKVLPKLLKILNLYNVKASFACVGKLIERYPREHQMIIKYGHEIINHTYTHPFNEELNSLKRFDKLTKDEQRAEIMQCHQICKEVLNYEPVGFRIPHFGIQYTDTIYDILSEIGYVYSSSILAVKSPTFGVPYSVNGILEFPIITCPKHPFQAFDTYHAFRSKVTSHQDGGEFFQTFKQIIDFAKSKSLYVSFYIDPQDIECFPIDKFLQQGIHVKTYRDLTNDIKGV